MILEFHMPKCSLKIYNDEHHKLNKTKPIFYSMFEDVMLKTVNESKSGFMST